MGQRVPQGSMYPTYAGVRLKTGESLRAIAKFPALETGPFEFVINEWMGTIAGGIAGLQTAPCFLVEVPDLVREHLRQRHGLNLTSEFGFATQVSRIDPLFYPSTLLGMAEEDLARLYCFDMLFINADRTPANPNCGQADGSLFAYDFGSAFLSAGTSPLRFDWPYFDPHLRDRANAHLCKGLLQSPSLVYDVLLDILERVCDSDWCADLDATSLPAPLQTHLALLVKFMRFIGEERDMVVRQIVSTI